MPDLDKLWEEMEWAAFDAYEGENFGPVVRAALRVFNREMGLYPPPVSKGYEDEVSRGYADRVDDAVSALLTLAGEDDE